MKVNNTYMPVLFQNKDPVKETETHAIFTGTIATNKSAPNRHFRFTNRSLRSMARQINSDKIINVRVEHNQDFTIGKPLNAKFEYTEERTVATFDIQKDLEIQRSGFNSPSGYANSNDYISAIKGGTLKGISVGIRPERIKCSHCGEDMEPEIFFGMHVGYVDKNGHRKGMKFYVDKNGKESKKKTYGSKEVLIIAEMEEVDLFEFSVVNRPAIPGSEIFKKIQKTFSDGLFSDDHLKYLASEHSLSFSEDGVHLLGDSNKKYHYGGLTVDNTELLQSEIKQKDEVILKLQDAQAATDDHVEKLDADLLQLQDENKELRELKKGSEERDVELAKLRKEKQEFAAEQYKIELYNNLVEEMIVEAVEQWARVETADGRKPTFEERNTKAEHYRSIGNYKTIETHADADRRLATTKYRVKANKGTESASGSKVDFDRAK